MIAAVIKALAGWKGYAAVATASAILASAAVWTVQGWRYGAQIADMRRAQAQAQTEALTQARAIESQRAAAINEVQENAQKQITAANADAAASADAAGQLRVELEKLRARAAARHTTSAASSQGKPDSDPIGVLTDVLEGVESTGREISQYADQNRIAALACERGYDDVRSLP